MPNKLFVEEWQRQSKRATSLLLDAKVKFDIIDVSDSFFAREILRALSGEHRVPVLFANGIEYGGLDGVRRFLTE
jgi:glutaredoxin